MPQGQEFTAAEETKAPSPAQWPPLANVSKHCTMMYDILNAKVSATLYYVCMYYIWYTHAYIMLSKKYNVKG